MMPYIKKGKWRLEVCTRFEEKVIVLCVNTVDGRTSETVLDQKRIERVSLKIQTLGMNTP